MTLITRRRVCDVAHPVPQQRDDETRKDFEIRHAPMWVDAAGSADDVSHAGAIDLGARSTELDANFVVPDPRRRPHPLLEEAGVVLTLFERIAVRFHGAPAVGKEPHHLRTVVRLGLGADDLRAQQDRLHPPAGSDGRPGVRTEPQAWLFALGAEEGADEQEIVELGKATSYRVPLELRPPSEADSHLFEWQVTVVRLVETEVEGEPQTVQIGRESERRRFYWY